MSMSSTKPILVSRRHRSQCGRLGPLLAYIFFQILTRKWQVLSFPELSPLQRHQTGYSLLQEPLVISPVLFSLSPTASLAAQTGSGRGDCSYPEDLRGPLLGPRAPRKGNVCIKFLIQMLFNHLFFFLQNCGASSFLFLQPTEKIKRP